MCGITPDALLGCWSWVFRWGGQRSSLRTLSGSGLGGSIVVLEQHCLHHGPPRCFPWVMQDDIYQLQKSLRGFCVILAFFICLFGWLCVFFFSCKEYHHFKKPNGSIYFTRMNFHLSLGKRTHLRPVTDVCLSEELEAAGRVPWAASSFRRGLMLFPCC